MGVDHDPTLRDTSYPDDLKTEKNQMKSTASLCVILTLCLAALLWGVSPAQSIRNNDSEFGSWRESHRSDCQNQPEKKVCLDWYTASVGITDSCCMTDADIGSTDKSLCSEFRHRH